MIRQIVIAVLVALGLSACGVEVDQDLEALSLGLNQSEVASTQDPVPPPQHQPGEVTFALDTAGNLLLVSVVSTAPGGSGDDTSSTQDPIPPKVQNNSYEGPVSPADPIVYAVAGR
ncbi:MAG: hypothetical protein HY901_33060 [Deltaproteobacteria bacterium]|nr:hypothetical protein [Deltaproteobacteria bacterium]